MLNIKNTQQVANQSDDTKYNNFFNFLGKSVLQATTKQPAYFSNCNSCFTPLSLTLSALWSVQLKQPAHLGHFLQFNSHTQNMEIS